MASHDRAMSGKVANNNVGSDADTIDAVVSHYINTVNAVIIHHQEEQHATYRMIEIIGMCHRLQNSVNPTMLTLEALRLLDDFLRLQKKNWSGGSNPGKSPNIDRGRESAYDRLIEDYFCESPTYDDKTFRRRFRLSKQLFHRVSDGVQAVDTYFVQRPDATGRMGAAMIQKVTAALRMLAYGSSADQLDEWIRLGESTILKCLRQFVRAVNNAFGPEYLRAPTAEDTKRILAENAARGWPGCMGSIDCWLWKWKNCPSAWAGQYTGSKGTGCTAEMCCSADLWIWHLFCGNPGSLNDLNILDRSPLLHDIYAGKTPAVHYKIGDNEYTNPYWLADGIYPKMPLFVQGFSVPNDEIDKNFTMWQASARKDIERAFGVLQARWRIMALPAKSWDRFFLDDVVKCCVILHNMIVEEDRDLGTVPDTEFEDFEGNLISANFSIDIHERIDDAECIESAFAQMLARIEDLRDTACYYQLREDLKHHLFENYHRYSKAK